MPAPAINSALNFPVELIPAYVPIGGSAGQALAKNSATNYDLHWISVALTSDITNLQSQITTLQNQVSTINSQISALQTSVNTNTSDISDLKTRMTSAESSITNINSQITQLSSQVSSQLSMINTLNSQMSSAQTELDDHEQRIRTLEGQSVVPTDPYIGALVHVRDLSGHCQPAVVYEDWKAQNNQDIVSVVVVGPVRLSLSDWDSKIEVQKENGSVDYQPFNSWHWPERYYQGKVIPTRL